MKEEKTKISGVDLLDILLIVPNIPSDTIGSLNTRYKTCDGL